MPVELEGECRVFAPREGGPVRRGTLSEWRPIGRSSGAGSISLRVLEFAPGLSPGFVNAGADEVLYALEGAGTAYLNGHEVPMASETALFLAPDISFAVRNPGPDPIVLVSSRCPDPGHDTYAEPVTRPADEGIVAAGAGPESGSAPTTGGAVFRPDRLPVVRLKDRAPETVADRWYCLLVDREVGSMQVTQFIGAIPPGRAPDHYHEYEEVLYVLEGKGAMWTGKSHTPIGPGHCIYLPRRQPHCVENAGPDTMRLLGVFYPAGSPAESYRAG